MLEHDPVINEYQHDKFRPREADALQTLRKVASLVKPIMRQRGWKVGILTEFWPPEKNLLGLNWNKGQKICLRLRYPSDEKQFLPLEEVVDTMLHELCHIVHGPHDEPFHTLWNQLRTEHEQLIRKGYTGEGFLSNGNKLGGGRRIPMHEAQRRARAAAEKRRTLNAGSGQKLGGTPVARGQDIRRVIADAAARRATVTKGCASGSDRSKDIVEETAKTGFVTKADEEDANEEAIMLAYIDLIQEEEKEKYGDSFIPASKDNPAGSQGAAEKPQPNHQDPPPISSSSKRAPSSPIDLTRTPETDPFGSWTCEICTLDNPTTYLCCDACSIKRPSSSIPTPRTDPLPTPNNHAKNPRTPPTHNKTSQNNQNNSIHALTALNAASAQQAPKPLGWLCHRCGNWMESEWWTCAGCGAMKLSS